MIKSNTAQIEEYGVALRQYRTIEVCELRSKIFRQVVQKFCRLADASQENFVQHDGNRFKQGVRLNLCGIALNFEKLVYGALRFFNVVGHKFFQMLAIAFFLA